MAFELVSLERVDGQLDLHLTSGMWFEFTSCDVKSHWNRKQFLLGGMHVTSYDGTMIDTKSHYTCRQTTHTMLQRKMAIWISKRRSNKNRNFFLGFWLALRWYEDITSFRFLCPRLGRDASDWTQNFDYFLYLYYLFIFSSFFLLFRFLPFCASFPEHICCHRPIQMLFILRFYFRSPRLLFCIFFSTLMCIRVWITCTKGSKMTA